MDGYAADRKVYVENDAADGGEQDFTLATPDDIDVVSASLDDFNDLTEVFPLNGNDVKAQNVVLIILTGPQGRPRLRLNLHDLTTIPVGEVAVGAVGQT